MAYNWDIGGSNRPGRTDVAMNYDQQAEQLVIDLFREHLGRDPSANEIDWFSHRSQWATEDYIRNQPEYFSNSADAMGLGARIVRMARTIVPGYRIPQSDIRHWETENYSLEHIAELLMNTDYYRNMYKDKPEYMDEAEYRIRMEKMNFEAPMARAVWMRWNDGQQLSDEDLRKAYVDDESEQHRTLSRLRGYDIAARALQERKGENTLVKLGPAGPYQPMMRGISSYQGPVNLPKLDIYDKSTSDERRVAAMEPAPAPAERWLSPNDYQYQRENPEYRRPAQPVA